MQILIGIAFGLAVTGFLIFLFFQHPQFGRLPKGNYLKNLAKSPNFKDGRFQNLMPTPALAESTNYWKVAGKLLFQSTPRKRPSQALPSIKSDLKGLDPEENILVWFGHSSYFLQVEGVKILVDPVFSGSASPLPLGTRAFKGSDIFTVDDLPDIDLLLITHDHWDHLDYQTVSRLKPKVAQLTGALGTAPHFRSWGYEPSKIHEMDWDQHRDLENGLSLHTVSARHFAGRTFKRNSSLWTAFVLGTPKRKLFLGGDSGYGPHFEAIGKQLGPFDLAILENGQYNPDWRYIHLLPEQFFRAAKDLKAIKVLPVHHSKFSLSLHSWDAPLKAVSRLRTEADPPLLTPRIGEKVNLDADQSFDKWWEGIE